MQNSLRNIKKQKKVLPLAGLEPPILRFEAQCYNHYTNRAGWSGRDIFCLLSLKRGQILYDNIITPWPHSGALRLRHPLGIRRPPSGPTAPREPSESLRDGVISMLPRSARA